MNSLYVENEVRKKASKPVRLRNAKEINKIRECHSFEHQHCFVPVCSLHFMYCDYIEFMVDTEGKAPWCHPK